MPLKHCQKDNKKGWKFGKSGKCYVTPDAKKKAIKQGIAMGYRDEIHAEAVKYQVSKLLMQSQL